MLIKYNRNKLHGIHIGMTKSDAKAEQLCCWPTMKSKIVNYIGECKIFLKLSKSKVKELMILVVKKKP